MCVDAEHASVRRCALSDRLTAQKNRKQSFLNTEGLLGQGMEGRGAGVGGDRERVLTCQCGPLNLACVCPLNITGEKHPLISAVVGWRQNAVTSFLAAL